MTGSDVGIEPRRREERVDRLVRVLEPIAAGLADRDEVRELRVPLEDGQEPLALLDRALDVAHRLEDGDEAPARGLVVLVDLERLLERVRGALGLAELLRRSRRSASASRRPRGP